MESDFKEVLILLPMEGITETAGLWFETEDERLRRWEREETRGGLLREVKSIAMRKLTRRQKEVFRLFLQGKSQREIGAILGISRNTIKSRWGGLVRKLRKNTTHLSY